MYIIGSHRYDEDPNQKLGSGSEGAVYPFPGNRAQCVKLFHDPEPGDREAFKLADYRAKKIQAICRLNLHLPSQFAMPVEAARDVKGKVKGFLMAKVKPGFVKILEILKQPWRAANNIGLKEISNLFAGLIGEDLREIGKHGLVVGDINTGCVMINPALERTWVDTDSWSYPGFPCIATTELYAHPDLYPNLEKSKTFIPPTSEHDRFALVVMFVQVALQGAHPFRMGLHQKFTSLRERARNGVTIFDQGVTYPKVLPSPEILSDSLLDRIIKILKRKVSDVDFGKALAEFASMLTTCSQCGTDYHASRAHCPKCHEKTLVDMSKLAKLVIDSLYSSSGTVLRVQVIEKTLRLLNNVGGNLELVTIDDQGRVSTIATGIKSQKGAKYFFFAENMVIVRNPYEAPPVKIEIYAIEGRALHQINSTSTGGLENGQAIVNTSERFLYRTAGNTLMCANRFGRSALIEERVAQVHQTQTWFTVDHSTGADREALFGYDRALRDIQWFVIRGEKDGNKFSYHEVKLAAMRSTEKLVDFAVYFGKEQVLLVRKTALQGREYVRYSSIRLDGKVERDVLLKDGDSGYEHWESIHGKFFQGDSVLHVTTKGIVKHSFANNVYTHLEETEGVVTITDQLFRYGTKVGVARKGAILTVHRKV